MLNLLGADVPDIQLPAIRADAGSLGTLEVKQANVHTHSIPSLLCFYFKYITFLTKPTRNTDSI